MRRRKKQRTVSGIVKTVPLSIALAALTTTGAAFADADYDHVQVNLGSGKIYEFDLGKLSESADYASRVKRDLTEAFEKGGSILVQLGENEWVEFGQNASAVLTLSDIKDAADDYYRSPYQNVEMILPSPY
jgi:hypothetical protein